MAGRLSQLGGETNPILSQFAVGYKPVQGIARLVAPIVPSLTRTGTLMTFGKEGFMLYDTERALRAPAKKADFHLSTDTYTCAEHAFETQLDYAEIKEAEKYGASKILSLGQRAVSFTQRILELELEKAVADIILSGTYYASGNKVTLSGGDQFSDYANSDPIGVVDTGLAAARADMGIEPNTGVIGYTAWKKLKNHPALLAIYENVVKGILTPALVAEALGLEQLYVGKPVYSTDAGVFTDIWGDYMALIYMPPAAEMAEGTTPHTVIIEEEGYPMVKTYDEKKVRSYETTRRYQVKNVSTSYGYLISDLIA
jgi:hypothetical protein